MNCPICSNKMIKTKATAFGDEYDYCRTCKKELKEMQISSSKLNNVNSIKRVGSDIDTIKLGKYRSFTSRMYWDNWKEIFKECP